MNEKRTLRRRLAVDTLLSTSGSVAAILLMRGVSDPVPGFVVLLAWWTGCAALLSLAGLLLTGNSQVVMRYASLRGYSRLGRALLIKEAGMISLLGAFLVDSASVTQTIVNVGNVKPDVLIAMPITIPDVVFHRLRTNMNIPIMGGGLGVSCKVIDHALEIGMEACAVTDREKLSHYTDRHL